MNPPSLGEITQLNLLLNVPRKYYTHLPKTLQKKLQEHQKYLLYSAFRPEPVNDYERYCMERLKSWSLLRGIFRHLFQEIVLYPDDTFKRWSKYMAAFRQHYRRKLLEPIRFEHTDVKDIIYSQGQLLFSGRDCSFLLIAAFFAFVYYWAWHFGSRTMLDIHYFTCAYVFMFLEKWVEEHGGWSNLPPFEASDRLGYHYEKNRIYVLDDGKFPQEL